MAASIARCRQCIQLRNVARTSVRYSSSTGWIILLPEVPPDTAETNTLMRLHDNPKFSEISPQGMVRGCAKLSIQYDVELGKHIKQISDHNFKRSFSSVFDPIEKFAVPLNYAWMTARNLYYVKSSQYKKSFERSHGQVSRTRHDRWVNERLYNVVKELHADRSNLNEFQQRVVDLYRLEGRLNGIELPIKLKDHFKQHQKRLFTAQSHFRNRVMLTHNMFSHIVDDYNHIVEMPKELLTDLAVDKSNPERGPWRVTLNNNSYAPFLEYCSHRLARWNVWQAYQNRAFRNDHPDPHLTNHLEIKTIREFRGYIAKLYGYENYAEMKMETKMAGSVDNVLNMISNLRTKYEPVAYEEIAQLQKFAQSEGFTGKLEMWDIPYWRRRYHAAISTVDDRFLSQHFEFENVLNKLFKICHQFFGIDIQECTDEVETWDKNVRYFKVFDTENQSEIASFYVDPYAREDEKLTGTWVETGRDYSPLLGTTPISYVNFNLTAPSEGGPVLMDTQEVMFLFYEFGHALQQMLTTVPYSEIAGQKNIEWDALQICANVMSMIFFNPTMIQYVSSHYQTGESLDDQTALAVFKEGQRLMGGYETMKQLYYSAFDMEMCISEEHWAGAQKRLWKDFMPVPLSEDDNHPCSLTSIFCDEHAGSYYSFKWAEMIAADIYQAFEETGFKDPEQMAQVGGRFRETFLSLGGGVPASEVFRRFRGRDPSQDALLKYHGVTS